MIRKFFFRRLRIYFIYMLIPNLFVFIATFQLYAQRTEKDLIKEGEQTTLEIKTNFDLVINNALFQNDILTNNTRMSIALSNLLNSQDMSFSDSIYITSLRSILNSIIESHQYFDSIYLYLDPYERFFTSNNNIQNLSSSTDVNWKPIYDQMNRDRRIMVVKREFYQTSTRKTEVLSVIQRLLLKDGAIIVNINIDKLKNILDSTYTNPFESVYIVDEEGHLLISSRKTKATSLLTEADFAEVLLKEKTIEEVINDENQKWITLNDHKLLLNLRKDNGIGLTIISAIDYEARQERIITVIRSFILILLVNVLIVIPLAYMTTKRTFDQIAHMIAIFDEFEKGNLLEKPTNTIHDEYDVIMNNIIYLFLQTTALNHEIRDKQYQKEIAELTALQLQINPHFLFNTLQTLDLEVRKNNVASEYLSTIIKGVSDILKYALSDPQEDVTLREEVNYLKTYMSIQRFRFGDGFIIYYEYNELLEDVPVFRLMFQPLIENSLIHGIRNLDRKGYIKVKISKSKETLFCRVIDNGMGMSQEAIIGQYERISHPSSQNIGLTNLNRRLILKYGEEAALKIKSREGYGTIISFRIPLQKIDT